MTSTCYNRKNSPVYPGEFVPLVSQEDIEEQFREAGTWLPTQPLVNITDLDEAYKIEVAVPGVNPEDFYIRVDGNVLTITVLQKDCPHTEKGHFELHEFNCKCFQRHIILPENVDAEFARAEYNAGILYLYLSKTDRPCGPASSRIIVY